MKDEVFKMHENRLEWLEVKRFLSIRSSTSPIASKHEKFIVYLSDTTGFNIPWITYGDKADILFPHDHRVNSITLSSRGLLATASDINGNERWQIHVYDIKSGRLIHVAGDNVNINHPGAWSSNGLAMGYTSNTRNGVDFDPYIYRHGKGVQGPIIEMEGRNRVAEWLTDDHIIINHDNTNLDSDLMLLDLKRRKIINLTKHEGEALNSSPIKLDEKTFIYLTNQDREYVGIALYQVDKKSWKYIYTVEHDIEAMDISSDRKRVAFTVNVEGFSKLYIAPIDFSKVEEVEVPPGVISEVSWGEMGLAFSISSPKIGNEIWLYKLKEKAEQITYSPKYGLDMQSMIIPECIRYESYDGMKIPALMWKPIKGEPPYPAVVIIHGGPESQFRPKFQPLPQILAKLGYLVLAPNFRGSRGYGKTFIHLDDRERRLSSLKDIGSIVDWAVSQGLTEYGRVAVTGASYGGYATLMSMALYPDYWSCGVERVGMTSLVTFLKNTGPWRRKYRIPEYGDPEKDYEMLIEISPMTHAEKIKAPLMIIHGENDPRVPITEALQLVEKLKKLGRKVEFIKLGDEGHGLAKINNRVKILSKTIEFIMKHTPTVNRA
ncbi:MAG: S9 family peptidase [archaeon GB-1867-005]|nr:S9 family peptidase [Candidatus Culexmicrobium cathedralense]